MLVLTRKKNESIKIGKDVEIKVLAIEDGKVKIGISAPKNIEIHRKEIYDMIVEENRKASVEDIEIEKFKGFFKVNEKNKK